MKILCEYVNTDTHTCNICKYVYTHMHYLCTHTRTHTHTHGKPLSLYVNIYIHTCKFRAHMCKSVRPHVKLPSTPRPPPIAYCCHPSPWKQKKAQPTLRYHPTQATPTLFAFRRGKGSTEVVGPAHTHVNSVYKHANIYTHTHKLSVHICKHIHTHVNSVCAHT